MNNYERQNPVKEIKKTFEGHLVGTVVVLILSVIIGFFVSGAVYQYLAFTFGKLRHIYITESIAYGISRVPLVSLLLSGTLFFAYFKMLRLTNKYKVDYENGIERSTNTTFGDAHFMDEKELEENFIISPTIEDTKEEIFGYDQKGNVLSFIYPPGINHNRCFCGAPGSGKSSGIIKTDLYQCLRRGESIIVTDSKGDIYNETAAVFKYAGYLVKVINTKDFKNSNGFNVMASLDYTNPNFSNEAATIATIIVKNTQDKNDPMNYWADSEIVVLQMIIMLLASQPQYINAGMNNLYDVYLFCQKSIQEWDAIFANLPTSHPARILYTNFAKASDQNKGQMVNGLTNRLKIFANTLIKEVLSNNEVDFVEPMRRKCIYYVIIPDNDETFKFIASLFFTFSFKCQSDWHDKLPSDQKKKHLTVFYELDEYKNIGGVLDLEKKMSTLRSRKIIITIILQSIGQLTAIHGEDAAKEILNDSTIKGLLSTGDIETAEYFEKLLGTFTAVTYGERFVESATNVFHLRPERQVTKSETQAHLVNAADLMNDKFARDEIIYVLTSMGKAPVRCKICFAELSGEAIHPLEQKGRELGLKNHEWYRPHWRKVKEESSITPLSVKETTEATEKPSAPVTEIEPIEIKEVVAETPTEEKPSTKPIELTEVTEPSTDKSEKKDKPKKEEGKTEDKTKKDKLKELLLNGDL